MNSNPVPTRMADLRAAPFNPRRIDDPAKAALRKSLKVFGDLAGFVVNLTTGHIVCGHQRRDQLVHLDVSAIEWSEPYEVELGEDGKRFRSTERDGWATMPGGARFRVRQVAWPEPFEKAANITANSPFLAGVFTDDLGPLLRELQVDLPGLVGDLRLDELLGEISATDAAGDVSEGPEPKLDQADELRKVWGVEPGQLWVIPSKVRPGEFHRLLCGDSTVAEDVLRVMDGKRAVLFATDPPYLVGYDGTNHPSKKAGSKWGGAMVAGKDGREPSAPDKNKDWSDDYHDLDNWDNPVQGEALYDGFVDMAVQHAVTERAAWYCWHASRHQAMLERVWTKYGAFVHQQIIWSKNRGILTRSWFLWAHECCFMGWVRPNKPKRCSSDYPTSVWSFPTVDGFDGTLHPTSKPIEVFAIPMRQHTEPGDVCYEPFSGSGSQIVAGEQLGRLVYAIEKHPKFVAVELQRLADMNLVPERR